MYNDARGSRIQGLRVYNGPTLYDGIDSVAANNPDRFPVLVTSPTHVTVTGGSITLQLIDDNGSGGPILNALIFRLL